MGDSAADFREQLPYIVLNLMFKHTSPLINTDNGVDIFVNNSHCICITVAEREKERERKETDQGGSRLIRTWRLFQKRWIRIRL